MAESADATGEFRRSGRRWAMWSSAGHSDPAGSGAETPSRPHGTIRYLWDGIRRLLGFGVMRVSAPLRRVDSAEPACVRARLERARIRERYFYFQEISQNADRHMEKPPEGRIELVLPYDGDRYFSRQARKDVDHARQLGADPAAKALIGHLLLTGFEHADLDGLPDLGPTHGSVPIRVPIAGLPGPDEPDLLVADRRACVMSHKYRPDTRHFKVEPVDVDAKLHDPDDAQFSPSHVAGDFDGQRLRIMRQVGFRPELWLRMAVHLDIPRELAAGARVTVRQVFIRWPTHTSLRALRLRVGERPHSLRYNPKREGLEWFDIPMTPEADPGAGEIRTFSSRAMILEIPQPGELYKKPSLDGEVKITVNRLLSGMDARLYDATGTLHGQPPVMRQSVIATKFKLILDDAFARRVLSPHQQVHFDEVIPAETRIDDIKMALRNLGFTVKDPWPEHGPEKRWLWAVRAEGPDTLWLRLYVEGKQHRSRRQRRVPGGITYRTDLDSGEMRIYAYGSLAGTSHPVVREMNALRETLRERFERLPARR